MITVYSQPGCPRCKRIRQWLKENNIEYASASLLAVLADSGRFEAEILMTEEPERLADLTGLDQAAIQNRQTLREWLQNNPSALNRPLIVCDPHEKNSDAVLSVKAHLDNPYSQRCPQSCPVLSFCAGARKNDCVPLLFEDPKEQPASH